MPPCTQLTNSNEISHIQGTMFLSVSYRFAYMGYKGRSSEPELVAVSMPRRRKMKLPPRVKLTASELEARMMAMLRARKSCAKLKAVGFVLSRSTLRSLSARQE